MQLYPDLAVKDSLFNRTFVELVEHTSQKDPALLAEIDWPIILAHHAARILGVTSEASTSASASKPGTVTTTSVIRDENPLERGAYNRSRVVNPRSFYYYNGSYYYYYNQ